MSAFDPDPGCVFCAPNKRTTWSEGGLSICSDPAPLARGHLLVYTVDHYPSAADSEYPLAERMDALHKDLASILGRRYGSFVVFEHGRTGHCIRSRSGERLCHHTHVHYIPTSTDLRALARFSQPEAVQSWEEVVDLGQDTSGYAVIGDEASELIFYPISRELPPHHLRTLLAEAAGNPHMADWEEFIRAPESEVIWEESHAEVVDITTELQEMRSTE